MQRIVHRWHAYLLGAAIVLFGPAVLSQPALAAFIQQGPKLVGMGAVGDAQQGHSVALSADGNVMIVGGFLDDNGAGAAWVFTRGNGVSLTPILCKRSQVIT